MTHTNIPLPPVGPSGDRLPPPRGEGVAWSSLAAATILLLSLAAPAFAASYDGKTPPALPDGTGGLAGLSEKDVAMLRRTRDLLGPIIRNANSNWSLRRDAVQARARIHEALNDWGRTGQLDFYLDALLDERQSYVQEELIKCAQTAAKAREPHFGGVHAFWQKLDALLAERGRGRSDRMDRVWKSFDYVPRSAMKLAVDLDCRLKPLLLTLPKLDMEKALQPFREPKKR